MNMSLALIGFLGNLPTLRCFVHSDAGTTQTAEFLPLLTGLSFQASEGYVKRLNTSVVFIILLFYFRKGDGVSLTTRG